jgi:hypothetical protein
MPRKQTHTDYDGNWKTAIMRLLKDGIAFFMPDLHNDVDWTKDPELLGQELRYIHRLMRSRGKRITDLLIKFSMKDGTEKIVILHWEIEKEGEDDFNKRMFSYFSLATIQHDLPVVGLALFIGKRLPRPLANFTQFCYNTSVHYFYNTYCIIHQTEEELLKSDNIFALFVLANLYALQTEGKEKALSRFEFKKKIYEIALEREIPLEKIEELCTFVFQIMGLPIKLEKKFTQYMKTLVERKDPLEAAHAKAKKKVFGILFSAYYGKNPEEFIEDANKLMADASQKAKAAEVASQKAEVASQKAEVASQKAEAEHKEKRLLVKKLYFVKKWSIKDIAEAMEKPLEYVEQLIKEED